MSQRKGRKKVSPDTGSKDAGTETTRQRVSVDTDNTRIPDTLTLARLDRENRGPWENEYSYGGEADLNRHYDSCDKNPGHGNFIPVDKFSIEDLPQGYRDNDIVDYIRAHSELTVRVSVSHDSDRSPATVPGSDESYPGDTERGQQKMTVGTGFVNSVTMFRDSMAETCKCRDCLNSPTPVTTFAILHITTASHILSDDLEKERTTCQLLFDRGNTPDSCAGVVTLTNISYAESSINGDRFYMNHITHEMGLAHRLNDALRLTLELKDKIASKLPQIWKLKLKPATPYKQPLLFLVSHPHGCSKQISIGRWTGAQQFNNAINSFQYTTPTCPGSGGARVCLVQKFTSPDTDVILFTFHEVHCGKSDLHDGINYCKAYIDFPWLESVYLDMLQLAGGPWEDNFSCVEEEDLHKHYETCQKNPGHQNVFPVEKFAMDNLPPCYRTDNIVELVKSVSDLTVRVSVNHVSEERPETVPGTDIRYPWYSNRGGNQMRTGNGRITDVVQFKNDKFNKTCDCKECQNSITPKTEFARIYIKTAAHLVYDSLEGEHTTCHLLFDSGETPGVCKEVQLTNMRHIQSNAVRDTCEMTYVTHDMRLAKTLQKMTATYTQCLYSLERYDCLNTKKAGNHSGNKKTTQDTRLYIVVSHPHGCAKQVSVGYYSNHDNTNTEENRCPYTWVPCPGSSGAPVIVLGWESFYPCCE